MGQLTGPMSIGVTVGISSDELYLVLGRAKLYWNFSSIPKG